MDNKRFINKTTLHLENVGLAIKHFDWLILFTGPHSWMNTSCIKTGIKKLWAFPLPEYNWLAVIVLFILDCLLSQPVDPNSKEMPSPSALKHKIILKVNHSHHIFFLAHHKHNHTVVLLPMNFHCYISWHVSEVPVMNLGQACLSFFVG